ncbi:hypothetical protein OIU74_005850, partial [Salix koriyanagi]
MANLSGPILQLQPSMKILLKVQTFFGKSSKLFINPLAPNSVGGKALDLHHLFVEVTSRGGIEQVITDR